MFRNVVSILLVILLFGNINSAGQVRPFTIAFHHVVDDTILQIGNTYRNPFGEEYTMHLLKYYISDISLHTFAGQDIPFPGSHLVNELDSASKRIVLEVPSASITSISFLIGVDSIYNVSGVQSGDLDPIKGMFWTWNSGYIMAKLEATSPLSNQNNMVSYHIGGFRTGQQAARRVTLFIKSKVDGSISNVVINANINRWFSGAHELKISDQAVCTTPGGLATQYADNYAEMFTIASVR